MNRKFILIAALALILLAIDPALAGDVGTGCEIVGYDHNGYPITFCW